MPELRRDPVTGRWVCLAPGRASRPESVPAAIIANRGPSTHCPFCPGNEASTPPEVGAVRDGTAPDTPGWLVRAIPNLFPAFSAEEGPADLSNPLNELGPALGQCEVIIHSPDHDRWLPELSQEQAELVMRVTWERYRRHAVPGAASVVALYNHGREAGASLAHPHGQLFATRVSSPELELEMAGADAAYRSSGSCVFCRMLEQEIVAGERIVAEDDAYIAIAPWASRSPFETWIIPRFHVADFGQTAGDMAEKAGAFLRKVLWRLAQELGDVPINWYIHSVPNAAGETVESYHWHLEIRPRLGEVAGFEMATGTMINTLPPEAAAHRLRGHGDPDPDQSPPPSR